MRASRWTTNVVCAGLLGAVLSGCKSREDAFRAAKVPVIRFDSVLKAADSVRVPLADARLLLDVAGDSGFALKAPHDTMTVTDILAWARAEQARKAQVNAAALAADRARRDSVRKLLEPLLVVTVVKKTYLPRDPDSEQYEDYISLAFAYQNKGDKAIREGQRDVVLVLLRVGISRQVRLLDDRDDEEGLEQLPDAVPARPIRRQRRRVDLGLAGLLRPRPRQDIRHRHSVVRRFQGKSAVACHVQEEACVSERDPDAVGRLENGVEPDHGDLGGAKRVLARLAAREHRAKQAGAHDVRGPPRCAHRRSESVADERARRGP